MSYTRLLALALFLGLFVIPVSAQQAPLSYPETTEGDVVDDYHGTSVADPYRWLEDLDSDETHDWVTAQNALTFGYLEQIPEREAFKERLTELWNYPRYSAPSKKGNRYFFSKNDGLQNQSVIYVQETLDAEARVLIDPNTFSADGTVALSGLYISDDGRYAAYSISESGSDWRTFRVRNVDTGQDLDDDLRWIKFSGAAWDAEGHGFFYSRYDPPAEGDAFEQVNKNQKLYYHRLGTPQADDVLVYERPDAPELSFGGSVTDDGHYLIIRVGKGTDRRNLIYYKDLIDPDAEINPVFDDFEASYTFVGNTGTEFYFLTDEGAPNKELIVVQTGSYNPGTWSTLIPESNVVLRSVALINDHFVVTALDDVKGRLTIHDLGGFLVKEIALPTLGNVGGLTGARDGDEMFYTFTSFTYPPTIYRYDFTAETAQIFRAPEVDFDASAYITKQVFYESKDGTRVPMFIIHKKDLNLDGSNPTYLYAYGGFNISMTPRFGISTLAWLERGGIYAQPSLRGGSEYGEEWHRAGMLANKQNVFDDFIAAAEFLIDEGYTSTPKLAIGGGSNGGLLVGAALTQRPELFGAAYPAVGVMDMLRFHKFTIGWAWVAEYGSSDDPEQFAFLKAYSPLHNLKPGIAYPPTLVTTSDHDDRVVPGHSYKFTATMQAAQAGIAPVLIRIQTKAGHGAGRPTSMVIQTEADKWAFLSRALGISSPEALPAGTGVEDKNK